MCFGGLKFFKGRNPRVGVIQAHHHAHCNLIIVQVIEKRSAVGVRIERPACGVHNEARFGLGWIDFPKFFDANSIGLGVAPLVKLEFGDEFAA